MTGRMSHDHGVLVNGQTPRDGAANFGQLLRDGGYDTAWAGRWHLPEPYPTRAQPPPGFEALLTDDFARMPDRHLGAVTDQPVTDAAIDFLQRDHTQPFCLGVALCNPHDICYWIIDPDAPAPDGPHPELPENFKRDAQEPEFISWCRQRQHYGQESSFTTDWPHDRWRAYLAEYYRLTQRVDEQIGRLLQALEDAGLAEETLVVCTSDHGEGMAAHELVVKLMLYEEATAVPLLLRGPGIPAGETRSQLASLIDILPTFCDAAGIEAPGDLPGQSLLATAMDPKLPGPDHLVTQLYPDTEDLDRCGRMLRTRTHKYICFNQGQRPEMLFDLQADPGERRNLALESGAQQTLQQHRQMLGEWMTSSGDPFRPSVPSH